MFIVVDTIQEHIAIAEANNLGIRTMAMVDTNANPEEVDIAIPANDDASSSVRVITDYLVKCIKEGLAERESASKEKETEAAAKA